MSKYSINRSVICVLFDIAMTFPANTLMTVMSLATSNIPLKTTEFLLSIQFGGTECMELKRMGMWDIWGGEYLFFLGGWGMEWGVPTSQGNVGCNFR